MLKNTLTLSYSTRLIYIIAFLFAGFGLILIGCGSKVNTATTNPSSSNTSTIADLSASSGELTNGQNISLLTQSPQLTWSNMPQAASYLAVLTDGENMLWGKYNLTSAQLAKGDASAGTSIMPFSAPNPSKDKEDYFFIIAGLSESSIKLDTSDSSEMNSLAKKVYQTYKNLHSYTTNSVIFNDDSTPVKQVKFFALGAISGYAEKGYKEKAEVSVQTVYQKESDGAPTRPSWVDAFRWYPQANFFQQGRYALVWAKYPGERSKFAERWEVHQIIFKDPAAMQGASKWGKVISPDDVKSISIIHSDDNLTNVSFTNTIDFKLPTDILPPVTGTSTSTESSTAYPAFTIPVNAGTQVGYLPILPTNNNNRNAVVAYKIRIFASADIINPDGTISNVERYNDSVVQMVDYKKGLFVQIAGGGNSGGGSGGGSSPTDLVPDTITNLTQLRQAAGITAPAIFKTDWENNKITGTAPIEELMTKADFEALFPPDVRKDYHDRNRTYYTWENFVAASRYFTNFVNEGSKENRYRELAAFLGNKSHEAGDGYPALKAKRWSYGLVWIVELTALSGSGLSTNPENQEDLYKAYVGTGYIDRANANYPPVDGKSYHGRGPVQLSWNYNYGQMSETLFGDKNILLANPNLIARNGILGWASAIWFWMQPQRPKPSAHDVMVGNLDFSEPYTPATNIASRVVRTITTNSIGSLADGTVVDYSASGSGYRAPQGAEIGFGLTINIINGGLESSVKIDNRHAKRIGYFARYLDYFGTTKNGRDDKQNLPISPQVKAPAGDPVPDVTITAFKNWRNWHFAPQDYTTDTTHSFPTDPAIMPSIISSSQASRF